MACPPEGELDFTLGDLLGVFWPCGECWPQDAEGMGSIGHVNRSRRMRNGLPIEERGTSPLGIAIRAVGAEIGPILGGGGGAGGRGGGYPPPPPPLGGYRFPVVPEVR